MLVYTEAPILEDYSNNTGARSKTQRKQRRKQAGQKFKGGYTRFKEAGGLPVIENLLGLSVPPTGAETGTSTQTQQDNLNTGGNVDDNLGRQIQGAGLTTTQKWMIGLGVVAVLGVAGFFIYKRYAGNKKAAGKKISK